ncbi:MAG: Lrp/AsnC family transcriptional regulator [Desulfovibrionales bacterium]|nr:Lrp/AsnC family transcriptional regulator [Desulfovibrionales bacterium]
MLDKTDIKILNILQSNGKISNAELARLIGMAPSGVLERVKKLEQKGIIQGFEVRLNPKALGISLSTFIQIKTSDSVGSSDIGRQIAAFPEVQEVHWTAGEYNYLVKARVSGTDTLTILMKKFGEIPGVRDSRTTLVLDTLKETQALSMDFVKCRQPKKSPK